MDGGKIREIHGCSQMNQILKINENHYDRAVQDSPGVFFNEGK